MSDTIDLALAHWPPLSSLLTPPRTEAEYARLVRVLDEFLDAGAADEKHPLVGLVTVIGALIEAYDEEWHPMPAVRGAGLLRYLMDEHGLRQCDLPEVGPQPVVSAILAGRRTINARQAQRLAERFNVDAGVFLAPAPRSAAKRGSASRRPGSSKGRGLARG